MVVELRWQHVCETVCGSLKQKVFFSHNKCKFWRGFDFVARVKFSLKDAEKREVSRSAAEQNQDTSLVYKSLRFHSVVKNIIFKFGKTLCQIKD